MTDAYRLLSGVDEPEPENETAEAEVESTAESESAVPVTESKFEVVKEDEAEPAEPATSWDRQAKLDKVWSMLSRAVKELFTEPELRLTSTFLVSQLTKRFGTFAQPSTSEAVDNLERENATLELKLDQANARIADLEQSNAELERLLTPARAAA